MIDKCSCGATCSQVEKLQAEIAMLSADNERLRAYLRYSQYLFNIENKLRSYG
jgi:hypothetical protein